MNWLDIVIIVFLAIATIGGLRMGIVKAILSLAGIVVGIILAVRYYVPFSEQLTFISSETIAEIAAFAIILVGVLVIARLIAWLLERAASALMIGWLNRIGGAIFGLVVGALLISTVLALWVKYLGMADIIAESRLASILLYYLPFTLPLLPEDRLRPPF